MCQTFNTFALLYSQHTPYIYNIQFYYITQGNRRTITQNFRNQPVPGNHIHRTNTITHDTDKNALRIERTRECSSRLTLITLYVVAVVNAGGLPLPLIFRLSTSLVLFSPIRVLSLINAPFLRSLPVLCARS